MTKTITLSSTSIASINLNEELDLEGNVVGIVSMVSYRVHDENGNPRTHNTSLKFTSGSDKEGQKMTSDAEEKLMAYWNAMNELMKKREEL
jgi:hypothetical protein